MLLLQFCGGVVVKMYTIQRRRPNNIQNKAIQTKIHIYQQVHYKKYYECSKYSLSNIRVCVCVRERERESVCVCVIN